MPLRTGHITQHAAYFDVIDAYYSADLLPISVRESTSLFDSADDSTECHASPLRNSELDIRYSTILSLGFDAASLYKAHAATALFMTL